VISGDPERGGFLFASCAACHGTRGEGNESLHAPKLAGQSDWYLARQLAKFASGVRGSAAGDIYGAQMRASVSVLADGNDVDDVVAYINTLH
jgi:cytochrome c oxidase subunit 2